MDMIGSISQARDNDRHAWRDILQTDASLETVVQHVDIVIVGLTADRTPSRRHPRNRSSRHSPPGSHELYDLFRCSPGIFDRLFGGLQYISVVSILVDRDL